MPTTSAVADSYDIQHPTFSQALTQPHYVDNLLNKPNNESKEHMLSAIRIEARRPLQSSAESSPRYTILLRTWRSQDRCCRRQLILLCINLPRKTGRLLLTINPRTTTKTPTTVTIQSKAKRWKRVLHLYNEHRCSFAPKQPHTVTTNT